MAFRAYLVDQEDAERRSQWLQQLAFGLPLRLFFTLFRQVFLSCSKVVAARGLISASASFTTAQLPYFSPLRWQMASHAALAVCSTAAYQSFLPLAGFPPAQGWCSTVSLLSKRNEQNNVNALAPRDVPCPLGSDLCALLADLKAADHEFARGVWYGQTSC